MWIHEKKKLIYLCNPKCGSQTLLAALKRHGFINFIGEPRLRESCRRQNSDIETAIEKYNGNWMHACMKTIVKFMKVIGKNPYDYKYFTVIREPIDRLISNFNYCKFDKDWHAYYCGPNGYCHTKNALLDFSKEFNYTYKGKYNYTINDYLSIGLEKSANLCTHPMPIIDYTEILDKRFDISIFKLENMNELKKFLDSHDICFDINFKKNSGKYDSFKIRNTITKENIDKIRNIYKYEYTYYYKNF